MKNLKLQFSYQTGCSVYSNYFFTVFSDSRNKLAHFLKAKGVYTTFRYYPLHKINLFVNEAKVTDMGGSNAFSSKALNIPIHNSLSDTDVNYIAKLLADYRA